MRKTAIIFSRVLNHVFSQVQGWSIARSVSPALPRRVALVAARLIAWRRQALGAVNSQFAQPRMQRLVGSIARQVHLPQARVRRLMGAVARIWVREYADARIILERNADLQYFYVSGRLQQRLMRAAMVSSGALAILVALLAGNNIRLAVQTARLTDTRARLLDTFRRLGGQDVPIDDTQEHLWAGQIVSEAQARQARLQNLLDTSIGALSDQNGRLSQDLRRAGIDEQKLAEVTGVPVPKKGKSPGGE